MKVFQVLIIITLLSSCKDNVRKLPYYDTADFTPKWELPADKTFHQIRPFTFTTQENETFSEKNMDGKICVADFFFTSCPGICPKLAASMAALQTEFLNDDKILLLSHTVTPQKDSVPVLKKYAEKNNVDYKRWKLLTGKQSDIYDLGRRYYFVEEDLGVNSDSTVFLHTENFVLVDKNRHLRGIYNALDPNSMQALKNDIAVLKKE
jgi:protein SCO1/2